MSSKKPKIVRVIARLNVGGPAKHVVWLTNGLKESFDTVLVAGRVPEGEEDMAYFAEDHRVEPWFLEEMSRELSLSDLAALLKLWRKLVAEKPDIVHTHTAKAGTLGRISAFLYRWLTPSTFIGRPRKVAVFHTFHGHIFHSYYSKAKTKVFLLIEKVLARFATDKIIVISEKQKEEIHGEFGIGKAGQFEVIPLGLDLQKLQREESARTSFRNEIAAAPEQLVVGIVGRLTEIKNHKLFIDAVREFRKNSDKSNIRFVIIGDGHLRQELEEYAGEGLVEFLGNRDDPAVFYSGLDVLALTSLNEGTPLSVIEAMANGIPWISTDVGGVADLAGESKSGESLGLLSDEKNSSSESLLNKGRVRIHQRGLLVDSNDVEAFSEAIEIVAEQSYVRDELVLNATEWVQQNYSVERLISDLEKLYTKVCPGLD